jgi:hypothetical protein
MTKFTAEQLQKWAGNGNGDRSWLAKEVLSLRNRLMEMYGAKESVKKPCDREHQSLLPSFADRMESLLKHLGAGS